MLLVELLRGLLNGMWPHKTTSEQRDHTTCTCSASLASQTHFLQKWVWLARLMLRLPWLRISAKVIINLVVALLPSVPLLAQARPTIQRILLLYCNTVT